MQPSFAGTKDLEWLYRAAAGPAGPFPSFSSYGTLTAAGTQGHVAKISSVSWGRSGCHQLQAQAQKPPAGIEPATVRLRSACSTS